MAPSPESSGTSEETRESLKKRIRENFSIFLRKDDGLEIRQLEMFQEHRNEKDKVQKLCIGSKTNGITKVILLVGATGTGKTTLINAMVNFVYGIDFGDDYRLLLVDDKNAPKKSQAESQTDYITAYAFNQFPGMPFTYNYVLIDTPGFGDTRGIQRDREMMKQLESFLKQDYGIDQVDGVGFVTPASAARLTQTQRYVYDGLASMFGKDIKDNIFIMATFADAKSPPVIEALKEAGIKYGGVYKFNNSALYAQNNAVAQNIGTDSDSDNDDSAQISKLFWEMGLRSMNNFFLKLGKTTPASLTLTKEVLEERGRLQVIVVGLQNQIHLGLGKLNNLNQERNMLNQFKEDMKGSANYTEYVEVPKITKIDLKPKEHVTNCLKCNMTCHYPCSRLDSDKAKCWAMTNSHCRICPGRCFWDVHKNHTFRYEHKWIQEKRTVQELLDRYNKAQKGKITKEVAINAIVSEINHLAKNLTRMIVEAQYHVERLEEIALKPNPLSTREYIDLMIESEKMQKQHNFEERIKMLNKLKEEVTLIQIVRGSFDQTSYESLFQQFQDEMK